MAKAKQKRGRKAPASGSARRAVPPDTSVLAHYSPTNPSESHPSWVKDRFPGYVDPHAGHARSSVREFAHAGHVVRIITTYRVEVDGREVQAHLSVDEDGQVFSHALPFVSYGSAVDLIKDVINAYSAEFTDPHHDGHHDGQEHDRHAGHVHDPEGH
jgi:hypothetical protein